MIPCNPINRKFVLIIFVFSLFSFSKISAQDGKALFSANCASCHSPFKDLTGPALKGLEERGPWSDRKQLYAWIHNPPGYMTGSKYTQDLKNKFGSMMQSFPSLPEKDIDAIVDYINKVQPPTPPTTTPGTPGADNKNWVIFGVISLIMAIIALILMQVNSNLKKLSDDHEQILRPEPVPFYKNKVYIALITIVLFILGGYYLTRGAISLGRQKSYEPKQPIYYSHKVHAGLNQISCLYCHGNAWESKHAAIPSVNVCMNCHKSIQSYEKGPKLYDEAGEEINGTLEIQKLYKYAGFDPTNAAKWNPSMAKQVEWVKIHNLPDHVFFSHAQHVRAGKVQCQTCHGPITEMDEVKQFSELSMGWCINCHRETKVNFNYNDSTGNKFYSIYEKFHNDIKAGKMDSVTVKDIGGIECQRCHY
ncbi:MAG TPA: c-type cytochrome [Chitinophagaceae bacterium]|jgi:cytochrome c551/c552|nr:c-type cytochrome [Chitinophagaceae bacterium]